MKKLNPSPISNSRNSQNFYLNTSEVMIHWLNQLQTLLSCFARWEGPWSLLFSLLLSLSIYWKICSLLGVLYPKEATSSSVLYWSYYIYSLLLFINCLTKILSSLAKPCILEKQDLWFIFVYICTKAIFIKYTLYIPINKLCQEKQINQLWNTIYLLSPYVIQSVVLCMKEKIKLYIKKGLYRVILFYIWGNKI